MALESLERRVQSKAVMCLEGSQDCVAVESAVQKIGLRVLGRCLGVGALERGRVLHNSEKGFSRRQKHAFSESTAPLCACALLKRNSQSTQTF